jgi:hypothetical protein
VPLLHGYTMTAISGFRVIMNDISSRLFTESKVSRPSLSMEETLGLRARLLDWHVNLPSPLSAEHVVFPSHLKVQ